MIHEDSYLWVPSLPPQLCRLSKAMLGIHSTVSPVKQPGQTHKAAWGHRDRHRSSVSARLVQEGRRICKQWPHALPRPQNPGHSHSVKGLRSGTPFPDKLRHASAGNSSKSVFTSTPLLDVPRSIPKSPPNTEESFLSFLPFTLGNLNRIISG